MADNTDIVAALENMTQQLREMTEAFTALGGRLDKAERDREPAAAKTGDKKTGAGSGKKKPTVIGGVISSLASSVNSAVGTIKSAVERAATYDIQRGASEFERNLTSAKKLTDDDPEDYLANYAMQMAQAGHPASREELTNLHNDMVARGHAMESARALAAEISGEVGGGGQGSPTSWYEQASMKLWYKGEGLAKAIWDNVSNYTSMGD